MLFSRALAIACLIFLSWALAFVALLLVVLIIVQHLRGDAVAQPIEQGTGAAVAFLLALGCRALARRFL